MDPQTNGTHENTKRAFGAAAPHDKGWATAPPDAGAPHEQNWTTAAHDAAAPHDKGWAGAAHNANAPHNQSWAATAHDVSAPHEKEWLPQSGLKPRLSRGPAIAIAALFCVILIGAGMFYAGIQETESGLRGAVWSKTDGDGVTLTLDFKDDVIDYNASTYLLWLGDYSVDIADIDYRVVAPGTIQARIDSWDGWRTLSVDVQGDVLTITPALTDGSSWEIWTHDYSAHLS